MAPSLLSLQLLILLLLSLIISANTAANLQPPPPILNASEALANSGKNSMSLTLSLIFPDLIHLQTPIALTIFSPPDSSFIADGQPNLADLLRHFVPLTLAPSSLNHLSSSSTLPTLSTKITVTGTTSSSISINNVEIATPPIYDDGSVVVYAIGKFFDANLVPKTPTVTDSPQILSDHNCVELGTDSRFRDATGVLKSRGYSIMASFLDLQLIGFVESSVKFTVFAPVDEDLVQFSGDFVDYSSIFMRHMVPCRVDWDDLNEMANGTTLNSSSGSGLQITKDEDGEMLMVNGLEITAPDLCDSEWMVIHGIRGMVSLPAEDD